MKNLSWKEIKDVLEKEKEFMEKSYLKYCDVVGTDNDASVLDEVEYSENIRTRLRNGEFIYKNGKILQVLGNKNRLEYYTLKGTFIDETTISKQFSSEKPKYKTDLICEYKSALTGEEIYVRRNDNGEFYTDFDGKIIDIKVDENKRKVFINGCLISKDDICEKRTASFGRRGDRYSTYISDTVDKDKVIKYMPSEYEKFDTNKKIGDYWRNDKVVMYENDFYIVVGEFNRDYYKVPTFSKDKMRYAVIDGIFYYSIVENDKKKQFSKRINSEYSEVIEGYYVRIVSGKVLFEDKPYSTYPRIYKINNEDVIVVGYKQCPINLNDFDFKLNELKTNNSSYKTVSEVKDSDIIIPYNKIFFIISEDGIVSVYDRKCSSGGIYNISYISNGLEKYTNIRYGRKKSDFYMLDEYVYVEGCGDGYRISLENYKENTIKAIATNILTVQNKNGETEVITTCGKKTKLKINISKDIVYSFSNSQIYIASFNKDEIDIQVNNRMFKIKNNNLYFNGEKVVDNVTYDRDHMEVIKNIPNSKLGEVSTKLLIPLSNIDKELFDLYCKEGLDIRYENEDYIAFFNRIDWKMECIISKKDGFKHNYDFNIFTDFVVLKSEKETVRKSKGNSVKFIISGWTVDSMALSKIYSLNEDLFREICTEVINNDKSSNKNGFMDLMKDTVNDVFYKCVKDNGIDISREAFDRYVDDRDFFDVILNFKNIKSNLSKSEFNILVSALEHQISGKPFEDEYLNKINDKNIRAFINHGINIEKFNNYDGKVEFVAHSAGSYTLKESLQETLFNQIQNLIGSRKFKQKGVLQVSSIEDLIGLGESFYNEVALDVVSSVEKKNNEYLKMVVREVNKLGQTIYKFLKSYDAEMDYVNREIVVNGVRAVEMPLKKLINLLNRFIFIIEGIQDKLKQINMDECIKLEVDKMLVWCVDHIKRDLNNVPEDFEDVKNPTLNIRLWNREDVLRNLTQGTRTHCCIALNSFNIGALVRYIFNKNIVLAEICEEDRIVGQAFIYMSVSRDKIDYRYENKRHIFMNIDNVEVNNNYSKYATDIGKNLQLFMHDFKNYVSSDKISDVLLGTAYNDIRPPYGFKVDMDIEVLGNNMYRDESTRFYKFL